MKTYQIKNLEELAIYFNTLASDQRACVKFQQTKKAKAECLLRASVWDDAANTVRDCEIKP